MSRLEGSTVANGSTTVGAGVVVHACRDSAGEVSGRLGSVEGAGMARSVRGEGGGDVLMMSSGLRFSAGGVVVMSPFSVAVKVWRANISDQRALRWAAEHWSLLAMKFQLGRSLASACQRAGLLAMVPESPNFHGVHRVVESDAWLMP